MFIPLFFSSTGFAQRTDKPHSDKYTFVFKGEFIEYALQQLVQTTEIDLIYDPAIMPDHVVYKTAKNETAENILRKILDESGLDFFRLSSGTYVLTKAPIKSVLHGNLTGRVIDEKTGEPLPGANITLAHAGGGASANGTGYFVIPNLTKGPHEINITYVGYKPIRDTVWVPLGGEDPRDFSLVAQPVLVEPLLISGIQKRLPGTTAFSNQINPERINDLSAFGNTDAIKSLGAVSGIDFSLPLADFNIQGGNAGEHQLRLDGVPIYNPVSMGRLLGAFSPYAIQKIKISKAGFDASKGSQLSGIINVKQDIGNANDNNFLLQVNPLNVNARFDHTFSPSEGPEIAIMLATRGSLWQWYQQPQLKQTLANWDRIDPLLTNQLLRSEPSDTFLQPRDHAYDITYYDLHAAARIKYNAFHQTIITAYRGKNILGNNLFSKNVIISNSSSNSDFFYSLDRYNSTNTVGKIEHQWLVNSRLDATISGYVTHHSLNHTYSINNYAGANFYDASIVGEKLLQNALSLDTGDQNAIIESSLKLKLHYSAAKNYSIEGALGGKHIDYRFHLSDLYYNAVQANDKSFLISGYLQNYISLSQKMELSVGSRFTFIPSRDLVFAEPRFSLKYDEPETSIGYLSFKLSGGIYRQFINQFDVSNVGPSSIVPSIRFWVPADYTTTVPKAYHLAGDILWEPTSTWDIRVESYYKWIPQRLALNYRTLSQFPSFSQLNSSFSIQQQFITPARGYAYGTGFSLEKGIPSVNMQLKTGYQLNIAEQRIPSRFGGSYQPLPTNQPHKLHASANWNIIPQLTFLIQWQEIWGRSWAFKRAYYDYLSIRKNDSFGRYDFNDPGSDKLPPFSQLNAGISYKQVVGNSTLRFRFDVFNVLNHKNVLSKWLSPFKAEDGSLSYQVQERTLTGFTPSLSVKFSY